MREGTIDLDKREMAKITNVLKVTTEDITGAFNACCTKILQRRDVEFFKPPFEVVIGCGGLSAKLSYWEVEPGEF